MIRTTTIGLGLSVLFLTTWLFATTTQAQTTQTLRYQANQNGDFALIGNSLGFDCATVVPQPIVGTVSNCGDNLQDNSVDVFWQLGSATAAGVSTSDAIGPTVASSAAMLQLPAGARITYARLYWAAIADVPEGTATLTAPNGSALPIVATDNFTYVWDSHTWYQSTIDVTPFVQSQGPGLYSVSDVTSFDYRGIFDNNPFEGWAMVVFYELQTVPPHNLALFDGFVFVNTNLPAPATIQGFVVPLTGYDAKLGVLAYEGDQVYAGDSLVFNGTALSDAQNPVDNFFNSTRSWLGVAMSVPGDLPQATGASGSMTGLDLDVVDITALVNPGDTSATITATSTGEDTYAVGAYITSISMLQPDLSFSLKTFTDANATALVLPGQTGIYNFTISNSGNDPAVGVVFRDTLPPQITYIPGTLNAQVDPNNPALLSLTDASGDDQGEFVSGPSNSTVVVRLGSGANVASGGMLTPGQQVTLSFNFTINEGVVGPVSNQALINASGLSGNPATNYSTRPTLTTTGPTIFVVSQCGSDEDCPTSAPNCDTVTNTCTPCPGNCSGSSPVCSPTTHQCIPCSTNSDCPTSDPVCTNGSCVPCTENSQCPMPTPVCNTATGGCVGCLTSNNCAPPTPVCVNQICVACGSNNDCATSPNGQFCLTTNQCGCESSGDCPTGQTCNPATSTCVTGCPAGMSCAASQPQSVNSTTPVVDGGSIEGGGVSCHNGGDPSLLFALAALLWLRRRRLPL